MSENSTLRIHAQVRPGAPEAKPIKIEKADAPRPRQRRQRRRLTRTDRLSRTDRLLRNTAYACALLLGVLALGNVEQPWAKKASDTVERALTMRIDLDESIGALEFVRNIMPESALVFMNLSGRAALERPVEGPVAHAWSNLQPWMMFNCATGTEVRAAGPGTVTAVSPLSGDRYGVLVDHGEGVESLYAQLTRVDVAQGDAVERGQALGAGGEDVYFEYRMNGESVDPAPEMGL